LNSERNCHEFVPINCAGIPSELLESELFGYQKGAFTGAFSDRKGLWETATRGTLFLDEIGELPLAQQAKVLRAIEDGVIYPLGAVEPVKVCARIVAATNRNLNAMAEARLFRDDLLQRLCGLVIQTPSLRRHPEEIRSLAQRFWKEESKGASELPDEILRELKSHYWFGNMRELRQVLKHLRELFGTKALKAEHIRAVFETRSRALGPRAIPDERASADAYRRDCLRTLSQAAKLVRSCELALAAIPNSGRISRLAWAPLRQTLNANGRQLEDLCGQPLWFHSRGTYQAIRTLLGALMELRDLPEEAARKKLSPKQAELKAAIESACAALFREAKWLSTIPGATVTSRSRI
jgi:transcriptional regulator with GAF, ATPase, and Fis domain